MASSYPFLRRNFSLGVVHGSFVMLGMAFIDPVTVLPVFITKLGGSAALIGLVSALHGVGWFLPQVVASRLAATRALLISLYRGLAACRSVSLAGVGLSVIVIGSSGGHLFAALFIGFLLLTHLIGGLAAVPFLEITSKTIPVTSRGMYFGTRRLVGGIFGVVAGMVVAIVLGASAEERGIAQPVFVELQAMAHALGLIGHAFPVDYGVLFLLSWVSMSVGLAAFAFAGEPPARHVQSSYRIADHIRLGIGLLRSDMHYRRFFYVRVCWQLTAMAFPFYSAFAYTELGMGESLVGLFLALWVGSGVVANVMWGKLLDRYGNKSVLIATAVLSTLPPLVVLVIDRSDGSATTSLPVIAAVASTFFANGLIRSGRLISDLAYLLEYAPETRRPLYFGFMNSLSFPLMLSPLLGGVVLEVAGVRTLFTLAAVAAVGNVVISTRLHEPRRRADETVSYTT